MQRRCFTFCLANIVYTYIKQYGYDSAFVKIVLKLGSIWASDDVLRYDYTNYYSSGLFLAVFWHNCLEGCGLWNSVPFRHTLKEKATQITNESRNLAPSVRLQSHGRTLILIAPLSVDFFRTFYGIYIFQTVYGAAKHCMARGPRRMV